MMKIVTIVGARPQFVKAGSVSREIALRVKNGANIVEVIVHTGQHYDQNMSDIFFDEMKIPKPKYFLGVQSKTHGAMLGRMVEKIESVLLVEKPDWVMLYGDTNSTLAGALAASKMHIKIAHIEAGLRSFNIKMPEEINRILTDRVSSLLFCPTQLAIENLTNEGINNWKSNTTVVLSGDVMQDSAMFYQNLDKEIPGLKVSNDFILCTIHRAENTDDNARLGNIISALNEIAKERQVILPLHPRTKNILSTSKFDISNLTIIDPVGYLNMVWLIKTCSLIMTDSGGLQKEAFFFAKPCITLRDDTEWGELVEGGFNVLTGAQKDLIMNAYLHNKFESDYSFPLYGGGKASQKIIESLLKKFEGED